MTNKFGEKFNLGGSGMKLAEKLANITDEKVRPFQGSKVATAFEFSPCKLPNQRVGPYARVCGRVPWMCA